MSFFFNYLPLILHYGIGASLGVVALALFFFFSFPYSKHIALALLVGALLWVGGYYAGERDGEKLGFVKGERARQAVWDDTVKLEKLLVKKAKEDAEKAIPKITEEEREADRAIPVIRPGCRVYDDLDRDCH